MARRFESDYEDDDYDDTSVRRSRARRSSASADGKTLAPGIALVVVSLLHLLGTVGFAPFYFIQLSNSPELAANQHRPGYVFGYFLGAGSVLILPAIVNFLVVIGGFAMVRQQLYPLALVGAFAACIPCCGPLAIVGIPFGIWAVVVLFDPDVRSTFYAHR